MEEKVKEEKLIERDGPEGKIKMLHNNNFKQLCFAGVGD